MRILRVTIHGRDARATYIRLQAVCRESNRSSTACNPRVHVLLAKYRRKLYPGECGLRILRLSQGRDARATF